MSLFKKHTYSQLLLLLAAFLLTGMLIALELRIRKSQDEIYTRIVSDSVAIKLIAAQGIALKQDQRMLVDSIDHYKRKFDLMNNKYVEALMTLESLKTRNHAQAHSQATPRTPRDDAPIRPAEPPTAPHALPDTLSPIDYE